jgi:hypothetical protein
VQGLRVSENQKRKLLSRNRQPAVGVVIASLENGAMETLENDLILVLTACRLDSEVAVRDPSVDGVRYLNRPAT